MKQDDLKKLYSDEENIVYDLRNTSMSIFNHQNEGYVLDEDIIFGKDYPTGSFDYDTYQILLSLKRHSRLDDILANPNLKTIHGEHLLKDNLINRNYIIPIASDDTDFKDEISKMNAGEVSQLLKRHGIVASGKRKKLVKLALENVTALDFEDCEFEISDKGRKFLEDFKWIEIYDICLNSFEFDDYYKFIDENETEDLIQATHNYLDAHFMHAHECMDFEYVSCCYDARAFLYIYTEELFKSLIEEIKNYIFRINPIYDYKDYYSMHFLLDYHDIHGIKSIAYQLEIDDLEDIFGEIWDLMDLEKEFLSKNEAYELLEKLFDENSFEKLCEEYQNNVIL